MEGVTCLTWVLFIEEGCGIAGLRLGIKRTASHLGPARWRSG